MTGASPPGSFSRSPKRGHPSQRRHRKPADRRPPSPGWASRLAAAQLLASVTDAGQSLDDAMEATPAYSRLTGPDRGFARATASAALRALGRIDRALVSFLDRPLDKTDPSVRALLRCGCAQLWVLDAPAYAVVSATVDAARQWPEARRGGGMVNAILRRADRERSVFTDLSPDTIWPDWLAARLKSALGEERARALAVLQLADPRIDVTVRSDPDAWAAKLGGERLPSGSVRLPSGAAITELEGYADGEWWVQDAAAATPARLLRNLDGANVADLCAAPGGKTLQLCAAGANVTAIDSDAGRMEWVRDNLARTKFAAQTLVADAAEWRPDAPLDAILLDAPCSALGTLRRHPDGAWTRTPKGLERYPEIQKALLDSAYDMLKPGGELVYCVCTPLPAEGADRIAAAIESGRWTASPIAADEVPGFEAALTPEGWLLTAPSGDKAPPITESDVFFAARLVRA